MTRPLVVFGDSCSAAASALRDALALRSEDYADGATVATRVPTIRSPEDSQLPLVLVALDNAVPHPSMANSADLLRVTVWHRDRDQAHDLAQLCAGLLHVHSGPVIRSTRPGTGPVPGLDPDSEVDIATFTVTANIRPTTLT